MKSITFLVIALLFSTPTFADEKYTEKSKAAICVKSGEMGMLFLKASRDGVDVMPIVEDTADKSSIIGYLMPKFLAEAVIRNSSSYSMTDAYIAGLLVCNAALKVKL